MTRKERRKQNQKKILNFIFTLIIISILFYIFVEIYMENFKGQDDYYKVKTLVVDEIYDKNINKNNSNLNEIEYPKEQIQEEYKGYKVIAKLEIPKIELETYIIKFSEEALKISVTQFWGPNPNEAGNFCVAGHNFKNKNMFHNLKKLKIGDVFTVKDNIIGVVNYEIYNIYTVFPEDISCLAQDTKGKKEVTLITCTSDSKKRIIIKAREVFNDN